MIEKQGCTLRIQKVASIKDLAKAEPSIEKTASTIVAKKDDNFLYFWAHAVTASDDPQNPIANKNGDIFTLEECRKAYPTFIGRNLHLDHDTSSVAKAVGKVFDAKLLHDPLARDGKGEYYIGCLCGVDKVAHPDIAMKVAHGVIDSVSMGASVTSNTCTICGCEATTPEMFCKHLNNLGRIDPETGKMCTAINHGVQFVELSLVGQPADPEALMQQVFAAETPKGLEKTADTKQVITLATANPKVATEFGNILSNVEGIEDLKVEGSLVSLSIEAKDTKTAEDVIKNISKEQGLDIKEPLKNEENLMKTEVKEELKEETKEELVPGVAKEDVKEDIKHDLDKEKEEAKGGEKEDKDIENLEGALKEADKGAISKVVDFLKKFIANEKKEGEDLKEYKSEEVVEKLEGKDEKKEDKKEEKVEETVKASAKGGLGKKAEEENIDVKAGDQTPEELATQLALETIEQQNSQEKESAKKEEDIEKEAKPEFKAEEEKGKDGKEYFDIKGPKESYKDEKGKDYHFKSKEKAEKEEGFLEAEHKYEHEDKAKKEDKKASLETAAAEVKEEVKEEVKPVEPAKSEPKADNKEIELIKQLEVVVKDKKAKGDEKGATALESVMKMLKKDNKVEEKEEVKEVKETKPTLPETADKEEIKEEVKENGKVEIAPKASADLKGTHYNIVNLDTNEVLAGPFNSKEEAEKKLAQEWPEDGVAGLDVDNIQVVEEIKKEEACGKSADISSDLDEYAKEDRKTWMPEEEEDKEPTDKEDKEPTDKELNQIEKNLPSLANITSINLIKTANLIDSKWIFGIKGSRRVVALNVKDLIVDAALHNKLNYLTSKEFKTALMNKFNEKKSFDSKSVIEVVAAFNEKIKVKPEEASSKIETSTKKAPNTTDKQKGVKADKTEVPQDMTDAGKAQKADTVNKKEDTSAVATSTKKAPDTKDTSIVAALKNKLASYEKNNASLQREVMNLKKQSELSKKMSRCKELVEKTISRGLLEVKEEYRQEELKKGASPIKAKEAAIKRTAEALMTDLLSLSDDEIAAKERIIDSFKVQAQVEKRPLHGVNASLEQRDSLEIVAQRLADEMQ